MIAILNGADFSANNVGQISIPVELSAWTKAVIAKYPNYSWDDNKRNALEFFYRSLLSSGVMEKMEYLALPILATTHAEAIANMISGGVDMSNVGISSKYEVTVGKGISRIAGIQSNTDMTFADPNRDSFLSEFHLAYCTTTSLPTNGASYSSPVQKGLDKGEVDNTYFGFNGATKGMGLIGHFNMNDATSQRYFERAPFMYPGINPTNFPPLRVLNGDVNFNNIPTTFVAFATNDTCGFSIGQQAVVSESLVPTDPGNQYANQVFYRPNFSQKTNPDYRRVYMNLGPVVIDNVLHCRKFGILSFGYSLTNEQNIAYQAAMARLVDAVKIN